MFHVEMRPDSNADYSLHCPVFVSITDIDTFEEEFVRIQTVCNRVTVWVNYVGAFIIIY